MKSVYKKYKENLIRTHFKLLENNDKEKIIKRARQKTTCCVRRNKDKGYSRFLVRNTTSEKTFPKNSKKKNPANLECYTQSQ